MVIVKKADKYKDLFSKEYLMGPNSVRLLEEMLEKYPLERGMRMTCPLQRNILMLL